MKTRLILISLIMCLGFFPTTAETHKLSGTKIGADKSFEYDLGARYVITRISWTPLNDKTLGIFEGANSEDFMDAVPLFLIKEKGKKGETTYADVNVSRGFRYVRYIGPNNARYNISELEFYGEEGEGNDKQFYQLTNLPLVTIHIVGAQEPKDKVNNLESTITIISEDGKKILTQPGTTRLRGNASMTFEKKPYRIKFDKKQNVLDAPAKAKKWTLINNYGDKTLMRNLIAFEISRRIGMEYTPYGRAVDVILNGEYKGCYQLCDQVEVNKKRVNVEEMDATCVSGEELTGGYLVEIDAYANGEPNYFYSTKGNPVTIKYPDSDDIAPEQTKYIKDHFNRLEKALFASNFKDAQNGYRKYLDLKSFLQHFIVGELSGNTDTYWSVNMYKHRGDDKFYVGPVWDFDIAFENDNRTYPINNKSDYIYRSGGSLAGNMRSFVDRIIIQDEGAKKQLWQMWNDLRNSGTITPENMTEFIRNLEAELDESQALNFTRWGNLNKYVHQNPRVYGSYKGEVDNVVKFLTKRIEWLDKKIGRDTNAIESVAEDPADWDDCRIFNLSGTEVSEQTSDLPDGVFIVKNKDGKTKIILKKN